jgi:hypothetical protein
MKSMDSDARPWKLTRGILRFYEQDVGIGCTVAHGVAA